MRVYAESNFVLELVLEQEQHQACEALMSLAASRSIDLVLPAFALLEPYQTLKRREIEGRNLQAQLKERKRHLQRTASLVRDISRLSEASDLLVRAEQEAATRFLAIRTRLLDTTDILAIDAARIREASRFSEELDLALPDALMFAAVLADAGPRRAPSIFLNRNTKDFDSPAVKTRLDQAGCALLNGFAEGLERVRASLPQRSPG